MLSRYRRHVLFAVYGFSHDSLGLCKDFPPTKALLLIQIIRKLSLHGLTRYLFDFQTWCPSYLKCFWFVRARNVGFFRYSHFNLRILGIRLNNCGPRIDQGLYPWVLSIEHFLSKARLRNWVSLIRIWMPELQEVSEGACLNQQHIRT